MSDIAFFGKESPQSYYFHGHNFEGFYDDSIHLVSRIVDIPLNELLGYIVLIFILLGEKSLERQTT